MGRLGCHSPLHDNSQSTVSVGYMAPYKSLATSTAFSDTELVLNAYDLHAHDPRENSENISADELNIKR